MTEMNDWFAATAGSVSLNEVSKRSGIPIASLHRYTQNGSFTAEAVVKIARAFDASIPDALVAQGIVTHSELSSLSISGTLADATDQQLLDEISRRLAAVPEGESDVFDSVPSGKGGTVHYPDFTREPVEDELAAASERIDDPNDSDEHFLN
ncbi:hypothetical protein MUN78_04605 [Leucobacter allii]|uniref:HTH cro/C1-type domain-containing protein n=1 Tax=Leucobacter allii TaxID=2932247 RepID=A0ABY4FPC7_9MICO|nr:helix-turn-helix domain-containing protein [Leucobacter allii]UOQ58133.1 hypothetical protein MUN78_04605 [Leucobacter allii]